MKPKWIKTVLIGLIFTTILGVELDMNEAHADRVNRRQSHQNKRIRQGIKSGELTHQEAKKLRSDRRKIRRIEKKAKSDGVVTPNEKAKIEKKQDKMSQEIYEMKHNEEKR